MILNPPFEILLSFLPDPDSAGGVRVYVTRSGAWAPEESSCVELGTQKKGTPELAEICAQLPRTWIFQASPKFSNVKGAVRSVEEPVCLVQQFTREIGPGDRVYLWECGTRAGIIALAEVLEAPRVQPEPAEQLPFIREGEKFAGEQLRVRLRIRKQISPVISRTYLLSRPELAGLTILRCARGTNFRVTQHEAAVLEKIVAEFEAFFPNAKVANEKRLSFAGGRL